MAASTTLLHFAARLRLLLRKWARESDAVAPKAARVSVLRLRLLCPIVALLNAVHVGIFYLAWRSNTADDVTVQWQWSLMVAHAVMGVLMLVASAVAHRIVRTPSAGAIRVFPAVVMALGLGFAVSVVVIDQWVTPSITPFLIASLATGLVVYLRPASATALYLVTYGLFYLGLGLQASAPAQLLSNRLNGITACVLGLSLSIVLWRKFTIITRQHAQLAQANAALEKLTRLDGLTGLYNRATFVELSQRELARARRADSTTAILLLDLDHFKQVNDSWGHPAGDAVLRHVASLLTGTVRNTDLVGRLGGEEFMVLLPDTNAVDALALAEKLRQRFEGNPASWDSGAIHVTVSIGMASTDPDAAVGFDTLYQAADKALYQAKQQGRNRVAAGQP
ncbi:GGDEF domain-containing protein [Curvibacter sp. APW13]|uniref:GGDEF domain-containing protein n=1 Tax=Curvibacter sp. APW13 TaxID=3077236 RepID=UPI0028DF4C72|nr:GGDEF domain-containing protein [Curvibacter sp. APW13]MDT8990250.1 GGDEF domain-containing protein [Curvibacter sp. APW13]